MNDGRWHRPPTGAYDADAAEREPEPDSPAMEAEYLQELAHRAAPVTVRLRTGETFRGSIEYYDQRFIRLTRQGEPNLFLFKHGIKYISED
jgi:host factor-I protein